MILTDSLREINPKPEQGKSCPDINHNKDNGIIIWPELAAHGHDSK